MNHRKQFTVLAILLIVYALCGDGSLKCDVRERYLWFWKINGGEKVGSAEVIQVDFGALHGAGLAMNTARFEIKVFHQGHASKETFAGFQARKEFGNPTARFKNAVLALQSIGGCGCTFLHR